MAEVSLPGHLIPLLGLLRPGDRTALSPLVPYSDGKAQVAQRQLLAQAGIADRNGGTDPRVITLLEPLERPARVVRILASSLREAGGVTIWHGTVGNATVAILPSGGNAVKVTSEAGVTEILAAAGFTESGTIRDPDPMAFSLTIPEAYAYAAVSDAERQHVLAEVMRISSTGTFASEPAVSGTPDVQAGLAAFADHPGEYLFLPLLNEMEIPVPVLPAPDLARTLQSLAERGILKNTGTGYQVAASYLPMVRRTLILDATTMIRIAKLTGSGTAIHESAGSVRADGMLLWFIRPDSAGGRILIKYVSASQEKDILEKIILDPKFSPTAIPDPAQPASEPGRKFCGQCGDAVAPGKQFCSLCGSKLS